MNFALWFAVGAAMLCTIVTIGISNNNKKVNNNKK